jgi:hypothetical protein
MYREHRRDRADMANTGSSRIAQALLWYTRNDTYFAVRRTRTRPRKGEKRMKRFIVHKIVDGREVETDHRYLVVNIDEPYAEKVFEMIRDEELSNGTWDGAEDFQEWLHQW